MPFPGCGILRKSAVILAAVLFIGGCAGTPEEAETGGWSSEDQWASSESDLAAAPDESDGDPLETPNRFIFALNEGLDVMVIKPAAATYRFLLPNMVRDSVRNFIRNLESPVILANDVLQGELDRAETTVMRFLINSTAGVLGLFDVAAGWGYEYHDEDFGQTLGSYGAGEGAYLVLPLLGPSSIRDGAGLVVDSFLDPLTYLVSQEILLARRGVKGIDTRSRHIETVEEIQRDAIDFYARVRSLYRQHRQDAIQNGLPAADSPAPGLSGTSEQSGDASLIQ